MKYLLSSLVMFSACAVGISTTAIAQDSPSDKPVYGPLKFNAERSGDFYFMQDGEFAPAALLDGVIEIRLKNRPFQIGYNGRQVNICLSQIPAPEIKADPKGYKASCLSEPMSGGREEHSDAMLVYSGKEWSDGNTDLTAATSLQTKPRKGYKWAYQFNKLEFLADENLNLDNFKGVLHGYIVVYKKPERRNQDIMPIKLVFE